MRRHTTNYFTFEKEKTNNKKILFDIFKNCISTQSLSTLTRVGILKDTDTMSAQLLTMWTCATKMLTTRTQCQTSN